MSFNPYPESFPGPGPWSMYYGKTGFIGPKYEILFTDWTIGIRGHKLTEYKRQKYALYPSGQKVVYGTQIRMEPNVQQKEVRMPPLQPQVQVNVPGHVVRNVLPGNRERLLALTDWTSRRQLL